MTIMKKICLLPLFFAVAIAQQTEQANDVYLLAGSLGGSLIANYPATLYRAEGGKPVLVRKIVGEADGVDFVLTDNDALVVGYPRFKPDRFSIIHFDSPKVADLATLPSRLIVVDAVVTHYPGISKTIALTRVISSGPFTTELTGIDEKGSGPSRSPPCWIGMRSQIPGGRVRLAARSQTICP